MEFVVQTLQLGIQEIQMDDNGIQRDDNSIQEMNKGKPWSKMEGTFSIFPQSGRYLMNDDLNYLNWNLNLIAQDIIAQIKPR